MTEKTKRKVNPRRRLLMRLILGIGLIVALIAAGTYLLRPAGVQIVFIAPDDNGVNNIWLADLNDPENPRQLTFHDSHIRDYEISDENGVLLYIYRSRDADNLAYISEIRLLNLQTLENTIIMTCDENPSCYHLDLHASGRWFTYVRSQLIDETLFREGIVYDIESSQEFIIQESEFYAQVAPATRFYTQWIRDTELVWMWTSPPYRDASRIDFFVTYDIESNELQEFEPLPFEYTPLFSDDGSRYASLLRVHRDYDTIVLEVQDMENPEQVLWEIEASGYSSGTTEPAEIYIRDWHPDNERLLVNEIWGSATVGIIRQLVVYDTTTGVRETLLRNDTFYYETASFNHDGSQILYLISDLRVSYAPQLMLYDMDTREEIALPLFGHSPQWVNGGR